MPQATTSASKRKNSILKPGLEIHMSWHVFVVNKPDFKWSDMGRMKTWLTDNESIRSCPRCSRNSNQQDWIWFFMVQFNRVA